MHSCEWNMEIVFCSSVAVHHIQEVHKVIFIQPLILVLQPCADLVKSDQGVAVRKLNVQMAAIVRLAVLMLDLACGDQGRQIARYLPVKH